MFRAIVWHPKSNIIKFETGWRNVTDEKGSVVWKNEGWGWTENK